MKIFYFLVFFSLSTSLFSQVGLVFSQSNDLVSEISMRVLKEAYERMDINVSSQILPSERALVYSNSGQTDGEVNRIKGIQKEYTNLIIVPIAINVIEVMVFTKNLDFLITGWESLKPYKISIKIGVKLYEKETAGMDVYPVGKDDLAIRLLQDEICDVTISSRVDGMRIINNRGFEDISILEPPIVTMNLYHYLNKKKISLLPEITKALEEMEAEGRIEEIRNEFIVDLFTKNNSSVYEF